MSLRSTLLISTAIAALTSASRAHSYESPIEPCYKAFEAALSQKLQPAPKWKEARFEDNETFGPISSAATEYTLTAISSRNRPIARASCIVNNDGTVVSLVELPPAR
jgi:hypothetical protein